MSATSNEPSWAVMATPSAESASERRAPPTGHKRGGIDLSDTERNEQRRLRFLQVVYDLANGTPSNRVQGPDVAEPLGLDVNSDEFHDLAYHHEKAGNIQAIETNWGRLALTVKGKAEVDRHAPPR